MRVVLLVRSLDVGGAETQLVALAIGLRKEFETAVVTFYPGGPLEARLREAGVALHCVGKTGRWDLLGFAARLRRLLRELKPDVLQSFLGPPNLVAAALRPAAARLVWGLRASDMDLGRYDWTHRAVFRLERALSSLPHRIVSNSYAGEAHVVAAGFPAAKVEVIPNGIDTDRFRPDPAAGRPLRDQWSPAGPLIGMVARLDPMKDHSTFLRAARILADARPDARFVCAGGGPADYAASLRQLAASLRLEERVLWTGPRSDVLAVYNALDIPTLSSAFGEGFPNAVGEAMACAKAPVVTDVGDSARVVAACGTVVPQGDPARLAAGWQALLAMGDAARSALGNSARQRIVSHFSVAAMVSATADLYRQIVAQA